MGLSLVVAFLLDDAYNVHRDNILGSIERTDHA